MIYIYKCSKCGELYEFKDKERSCWSDIIHIDFFCFGCGEIYLHKVGIKPPNKFLQKIKNLFSPKIPK